MGVGDGLPQTDAPANADQAQRQRQRRRGRVEEGVGAGRPMPRPTLWPESSSASATLNSPRQKFAEANALPQGCADRTATGRRLVPTGVSLWRPRAGTIWLMDGHPSRAEDQSELAQVGLQAGRSFTAPPALAKNAHREALAAAAEQKPNDANLFIPRWASICTSTARPSGRSSFPARGRNWPATMPSTSGLFCGTERRQKA